jgi:hypothetical protein
MDRRIAGEPRFLKVNGAAPGWTNARLKMRLDSDRVAAMLAKGVDLLTPEI